MKAVAGSETDLFQGTAVIVPMHRDVASVEPGQTRPIAFRISTFAGVPDRLYLQVNAILENGEPTHQEFKVSLRRRSIADPHKVTHLHPGGFVSYAILRAPSLKGAERSCKKLAPILLQLHGAGVEADSRIVAHSLDPLPDLCAFVLFPTGVTPWCGDDWHVWGFADVEAAVENIPTWIRRTRYSHIGVDTKRWIVSG